MDKSGDADLCSSCSSPRTGLCLVGTDFADWIFQMEGKDDDETDVLLNPARVLVGAYGYNKAVAEAFANWIARPDGGQKIVSGFRQNGVVLYTKAP